MPLRVAFDLDGVLADMESELLRQSDILFGAPKTSEPQESTESGVALAASGSGDAAGSKDAVPDVVSPVIRGRLTPGQQRRLWRHVESTENFWERLEELEPGIIERLAALAIARRWEIIFLTKRPETAGATAQRQSQRWLSARGFDLPSVYVVQGSRGRVAASLALDVVIDDRPENCLDVVVDSSARAILVWRSADSQPPATAVRLGIGVVRSVAECLDILCQIDSSPRQEPGVVTRVMRLLGFKEPASN